MTDPVGGSRGEEANTVSCGDDQVLAGMAVRHEGFIDTIAPRCVGLSPAGEWIGDPVQEGGLNGGTGGNAFNPIRCPADLPGKGLAVSNRKTGATAKWR